MRTKAEYQSSVLQELRVKIPGRASPDLLKAYDGLVGLGFRAKVHPKACAGLIALSDAEEDLKASRRTL